MCWLIPRPLWERRVEQGMCLRLGRLGLRGSVYLRFDFGGSGNLGIGFWGSEQVGLRDVLYLGLDFQGLG